MKESHFPSRLFRWFVGRQVFLSFICLVVTLGCFIYWVYNQTEIDERHQSLLIQSVVYTSLIGFSLFSVITILMTRRTVIPLGRLIEKTRRLRKFPFQIEELSDEELAFDEPGEWFELERALNKLGRDLRKKTVRLSREKTEFRAIVSAMKEAVLAIDRNGHPLFYNPQFSFLFKIENKNVEELVLSEIIRDPLVLGAYDRCLKSGQEERVKLKLELNKELHYFKVSISPLKMKHNQEIYGAVAVFNDVTDLKKAENIRIEFVGNVSHELRTPLTSVVGYLQTLKEDMLVGKTDQSLEFIEIIERNVARLKYLVDDLLDLSSLESRPDLNKKSVNVRSLTETVINMVPSKDHFIHLSFSVDTFQADEGRVEQVLRNLLQNSVRYIPKGKNIWIHWESTDDEILLRVKDDGPGIPQKHHERLFERFYRVDSSRAREQGGTGIGLSLVKHIMSSHGGRIELVSEEGKGAEFICHFPR